ncbi:MAG: hypothetical protein HF978_04720 [Desulfobacteraceae bacterium]|nr:hypothetical protein [Desulfobacteraceae bacterium]MBC2754833.1 hypothetical protein [Desulfobacteraceae bacterium]
MKSKKMTIDQAKDTGLAVILILLLFVYLGGCNYLVLPAIIVLVLTMTWPAIFKPLARFWFGLSHLLGSIISKILLSIIFYIVVTPIGLLRRVSGADSMRISKWKQNSKSVFIERNHTYSTTDLEKPY